MVKLVLLQCNLSDNQWQRTSELLYNFTPGKFYAYLLNAEPSNCVLKTYNTDFDDITITFTDENGRPWKIEDKGNLSLLINK